MCVCVCLQIPMSLYLKDREALVDFDGFGWWQLAGARALLDDEVREARLKIDLVSRDLWNERQRQALLLVVLCLFHFIEVHLRSEVRRLREELDGLRHGSEVGLSLTRSVSF